MLRPSSGAVATTEGNVEIVANLPAPSSARPWSLQWMLDRVGMVVTRAMKRNTLIRQRRPDVIHLQLLNRFTDLWMMPSGSVVATIHDALPHQHRLPWRMERLLLTRLYRTLSSIVVHHSSLAKQLHEEFKIPTERIRCIPLAIASNDALQVNRDLSLPTVLFFGAFRRNKGIEPLCDAIGLLAGQDHLRFHFAGRGEASEEERVLKLVDRDPRVTAEIGYVPNDVKERLFRAASLVVLPYTTFSSQSGVLGDAYASGTPVLVADVGALGESVHADGTGWVLPSTRPDDIASSIRQALSDAQEWQQRAERCEAVAAERSSAVIARSYRALYATLAQGRRD
ncbi:MAG TPA: glycosyltransferase family 4 protein [Acidimicrobiales bacterium]|nr:glycosyltransferase family 4 protein [Acidimicrobiales bacterium]